MQSSESIYHPDSEYEEVAVCLLTRHGNYGRARFCSPEDGYLEGLGNKTRHRICPAYIAGLIGPGDRKSIQPMAARSDAVPYDRLHHFIGAGLGDNAPLDATLWKQADQLVGGDGFWLIIDDAALPKKGKASVGVAPRYASHWVRMRTARQ